jgi:hypothetical protein
MVQGVGWLQVAKCTQGNIFNSIDEAHAGSRHDGIMTVASSSTNGNICYSTMVRPVQFAAGVGPEYSHSAVRYYYITNEPLGRVFHSSFL